MAAKKPKAKTARKVVAGTAAEAGPAPPAEETQSIPDTRSATLSAVPRQLKPAEPRKKPQPAPIEAPPKPQEPAAEPVSIEAMEVERANASGKVSDAEKPTDAPEPLPLAGRGDTGSLMKGFAVLALLGTAVFLAYYFISLPENSFVPGAEVDAETFKGIFLGASNIYIVMDVRGAGSDAASNAILQCGVDFAASSGMGGKTVTPISFGPDGCVAPDGEHPPKACFAMLKNGITIYVKEGPGGAKYYANGMVVSVGPQYAVGLCGIKKT